MPFHLSSGLELDARIVQNDQSQAVNEDDVETSFHPSLCLSSLLEIGP